MEKTRIKKVMICLIIGIIMINFIFSNISNAESSAVEKATQTLGVQTDKIESEESVAKIISGSLGMLLDGYIGYKTVLTRGFFVVIVSSFQFLATVVGENTGTLDSGTLSVITPREILFNRLAITDINFFNISSFGTLNNQKSLSNDNPIKVLRESIATWYMTLRMMAIIILLCVLIYIGIRMVLSTNSEKKAEYKKMFYNWFVSLALVFLLHYIIILILNVNSALVNMLDGTVAGALESERGFIFNYMNYLVLKAIINTATSGFTYLVVYTCIVGVTFVFLIMYIKRMITIAFLILISPIITITYSIDKVGDGQAQAFSTWFREFMQNVLIQPFHCIIYVAFVSIAIKNLQESGTLASAVLSIVMLVFMLQSEKIVKKIFKLDAESTGSSVATVATLGAIFKSLDPGKKFNQAKNVATNTYNEYKNSNSSNEAKPKNDSRVAEKNMNETEDKNNENNENTEDKKSHNLNKKLTEGEGAYEDYLNLMGFPSDDENKKLTDDSNKTNERVEDKNREDNEEKNRKTEDDNVQKTDNKPKEKEPVDMPEVKNNNPRTNGEKMQDETNETLETLKKYMKPSDINYAFTGGAISATLAAMAGQDLSTVVGSTMVGARAGQYVKQETEDLYEEKKMELKKMLNDIDVRDKERTLATAFSNHKDKKEYNRDADIQKARKYLGIDDDKIKDIQNKSERQYVQALHAMRDIYSKDNYNNEDPNEKVINTMEKIIKKEIKPKD